MLKEVIKIKNRGDVLEMCRKCYTFRHKNTWLLQRPKFLHQADTEDKVFVRFIQCPMCREKTLAAYHLPFPTAHHHTLLA